MADEIVVETSRGAFSTDCAHQLCRTVQRPHQPDGGRRTRRDDRSISRRILRPRTRACLAGAGADLSRARSALSVSRRALHPPHHRQSGCRPERRLALAREGYRHTDINVRDLASALTFPGFWRMARKHWRNGSGRMAAVAVEAGLRSSTAALAAGSGRERSGARRLRRARAGAQARRLVGRRFPVRAFRQSVARAQRSLAGGHGLVDHRQGDCRYCSREFRSRELS